MAKSKLPKLLLEIEAAMPQLIIFTARRIAPKEPIYAVIVCYSDNTSNEHMPFIIVCRERVRQWAKKYGAVNYDIWKPQVELSGSSKLFKIESLDDTGVEGEDYGLLRRADRTGQCR